MSVHPPKRVERPGQIDNSDIVLGVNGREGDEPELRRMLEEGQDYVLVSQEVWEKLFDWYLFLPFLIFVPLILSILWYHIYVFCYVNTQLLPLLLIVTFKFLCLYIKPFVVPHIYVFSYVNIQLLPLLLIVVLMW